MEEMTRAALARFGRIDILVCAAGTDVKPPAERRVPDPVADLPEAAWREVLEVNVRGAFLAMRAVIPAMAGGGDVVAVSSAEAGLAGQPLAAAYSASKFALGALCEAVAGEVARDGVRLQVIAPGLVETPLVSGHGLERRFGPPLPAARVGELIARLVSLPPDVTFGASRRDGMVVIRHAAGPASPGYAAPRRPASTPAAVRPLEESVALITGGASGIGRAAATALAARGARLVLVDSSASAVHVVAGALRAAGSEALPLALDVRSAADMEAMASEALERFGRVDIVIAAAGILRPRNCRPQPLVRTSPQEWDEVLDVNLTGVFLSNRAVLRAMLDQCSGQIINIASRSGRVGQPLDCAYSASKAGVLGLTEALRGEVSSRGVRVLALVPDVVDTPLWEQNHPVPRPREMLSADRVAEVLIDLITLPADVVVADPVIAPVRSRSKVKT
jgi:3-oxoacyl-[acyl-carrier protein] reductase